MDTARPSQTVSTGWSAVDDALRGAKGDQIASRETYARGLVRGAVHEWFGVSSAASPGSKQPTGRGEGWSPPLFLLTHLAGRAVSEALDRGAPDQVVWIGRSVWPYPRALSEANRVIQAGEAPSGSSAGHQLRLSVALAEDGEEAGPNLFHRSLLVAPEGQSKAHSGRQVSERQVSERLWAIDTALRCRGVTAVVADGTGLNMAATRRLQLAAASTGVLVLLARPPEDLGEISAATTRWSVTRSAPRSGSHSGHGSAALSWDLTLLRAKGAQRLVLQTEHTKGHTPKKITAELLEALAASAGSGGEDMGRRRNQPSIHRYVHSHAARLSTPSTFVFYRPIPAPPPKGDAPTWSPEDLLSSLDQNERRARLDRRALQ